MNKFESDFYIEDGMSFERDSLGNWISSTDIAQQNPLDQATKVQSARSAAEAAIDLSKKRDLTPEELAEAGSEAIQAWPNPPQDPKI